MRIASRWLGAFGAVVCVAAAVVMCVAAFATWHQGFLVPGEPYLLFTGFYVFLGGAVAAIPGALLMTSAGFMQSHARAATLSVPAPSSASTVR